MKQFAQQMKAEVRGGEVVLLIGELGSGKTTFVQGLARAVGIGEPVTSPTFTIVGEYDVPVGAHFKRLVHVDLYRLEAKEAQADPAIQEVLEQGSDPDRLTLIEWADRLGGKIPPGAWELYFQHGANSNERFISIKNP